MSTCVIYTLNKNKYIEKVTYASFKQCQTEFQFLSAEFERIDGKLGRRCRLKLDNGADSLAQVGDLLLELFQIER